MSQQTKSSTGAIRNSNWRADKYKRRAQHAGVSFLFAGALLQGIEANLTFGGCCVCLLEFALSPKSSFEVSRAQMLLPEGNDRGQKEAGVDTISCSLTLSVYQVVFSPVPSYSVRLSSLPSASLCAECYLCSKGFLFYFSW